MKKFIIHFRGMKYVEAENEEEAVNEPMNEIESKCDKFEITEVEEE